jgi:hypothetical protein
MLAHRDFAGIAAFGTLSAFLPATRWAPLDEQGRFAMAFVVKAKSPSGEISWIGLFRYGAYRALGPREMAEVFQTRRQAKSAVDELPQALVESGVTFQIESAARDIPGI